jgi:hypothetical protein
VIVIDHEGQMLASMCSSKSYIIKPTITTWKVVEFGRNLGIHNIILEDNAMEVVHVFRKENQSWSKYGNLIDNAKITLHSLQSWHVTHIRREENMAAHHLVKASLQHCSKQIWMEEYSSFIHDIVISKSCIVY